MLHNLNEKDEPAVLAEPVEIENERQTVEEYSKDDFVAAVYQSAWYIGKIIDQDETEVEIDFMERNKKLYH